MSKIETFDSMVAGEWMKEFLLELGEKGRPSYNYGKWDYCLSYPYNKVHVMVNGDGVVVVEHYEDMFNGLIANLVDPGVNDVVKRLISEVGKKRDNKESNNL